MATPTFKAPKSQFKAKPLIWQALALASSVAHAALAPGWGYPTDSLDHDFATWEKSPWVKSDSLGQSLEGRPIRHLQIQDPQAQSQRVLIHARTHPLEFQATMIAREMIRILLDTTAESKRLRQAAHWDFIPHTNPDGVERMENCPAGFGRCNAAGVDLERDWLDSTKEQPETKALRRFYELRLSQELPIAIALNLHSAFGCDRYFWTHAAAGTSDLFWDKQRNFVELVRKDWPTGILPHDAKVSWKTGNPGHFPESFWWKHRAENTMALTYEDRKECTSSADLYDRTALALLQGSVAYMSGDIASTQGQQQQDLPVVGRSLVRWPESWQGRTWSLVDIQGRIHASGIVSQETFLSELHLGPGMYIWQVQTPQGLWTHGWMVQP
jgi:hypothetical protein